MMENFDLIESILRGFESSLNTKYPLTFSNLIQTILELHMVILDDKKSKI